MKAEFLSFWLISLRDGSVEMMYSKERNKSTRTVSLEAKREVSSISLNILEYVTVYYTRNKKKNIQRRKSFRILRKCKILIDNILQILLSFTKLIFR